MADCSKTKVFLEEWERMCMSFDYCSSCDANKITCDTRCVEANRLGEMRNIVQKWSDEHPAPKPKTYADVFFEQFPNASKCYITEKDYMNGNGFPEVKRCNLYGVGINGCKEGSCTRETQMKCWNEPYKEEGESENDG